jgi:hypothetical protein
MVKAASISVFPVKTKDGSATFQFQTQTVERLKLRVITLVAKFMVRPKREAITSCGSGISLAQVLNWLRASSFAGQSSKENSCRFTLRHELPMRMVLDCPKRPGKHAKLVLRRFSCYATEYQRWFATLRVLRISLSVGCGRSEFQVGFRPSGLIRHGVKSDGKRG